MADWNPNAGGTAGLEWLPHTESSVTLDSATKCACQSMLQTASQATGTARVWVAGIPTRGGLYALEVYDNETAVPSNVTTLTAQPNEDVTLNGWTEDDGSTTTIYDQIDETTIDVADYIKASSTGKYYGRLNTGGLSLTGKRILGVQLTILYTYLGGFVGAIGLNLSGTDYTGTTVPYSLTLATRTATWLYNPSTKAPWTIAQVQALDTTDEWWVSAGVASGGSLFVYQAYLTVLIADENRIAVGPLDDTASALTANAWNAITLTTPTGGTWTKDGSGRHLYLLRRLNSTGALAVPTLAGTAAPNPARGFSPTLDPTNGYATEMGDSTPTVFPLIQRTTAPAESVDSQPYKDLLPALVFTGQDAEQEVSNHSSANYKRVRALVKPNSATADLLIKVKRRSDNVQLGATITLTKAAVDACPDEGNGWKAIDETMSSVAALVAATQYYIEFSSASAGTGTDYWSVVALDTGDQGNGATYQGTTDRAVVNGTEADRYDLAVTVASVPTAPSGFAYALGTQTRDATIRGTTTLKRVDASWSATALAGSFTRYELERSEDGGTTYVPVAWITTEATVAFSDYESPRGVAVSYRLRVVRSDGVASDWVTA